MEVLDVDVLVGRRLPLTPQQQPLFGRRLCGETQAFILKNPGFYYEKLSLIPVYSWVKGRCSEWKVFLLIQRSLLYVVVPKHLNEILKNSQCWNLKPSKSQLITPDI